MVVIQTLFNSYEPSRRFWKIFGWAPTLNLYCCPQNNISFWSGWRWVFGKVQEKISFKPFFRNSKLHRFWNILLPTTDGVFCVGMISSGSISSSSNWTGSRLLAEGIPDLFKSTFFGPLRGDVLLHLSSDPLLILSLFTERICRFTLPSFLSNLEKYFLY